MRVKSFRTSALQGLFKMGVVLVALVSAGVVASYDFLTGHHAPSVATTDSGALHVLLVGPTVPAILPIFVVGLVIWLGIVLQDRIWPREPKLKTTPTPRPTSLVGRVSAFVGMMFVFGLRGVFLLFFLALFMAAIYIDGARYRSITVTDDAVRFRAPFRAWSIGRDQVADLEVRSFPSRRRRPDRRHVTVTVVERSGRRHLSLDHSGRDADLIELHTRLRERIFGDGRPATQVASDGGDSSGH